jgi:CRISPR-associated protein Cmr2
MMANRWATKIQAYLFWPPDAALDVSGAEQRGKGYIDRVLPGFSMDENLLRRAHRIAFGPDVPPFLQSVPIDWAEDPKVTHPLAGHYTQISVPAWLDSNGVCPELLNALDEIAGKYGSDPKRLFLALWRLLPEKMQSRSSDWDVLPAHPAVPSHTIWEHASVASAIASALPDPALLVFTIASAQEFVSAARRTQDYWMGSLLLSHLTWKAMRRIVDEYGPDCFIYPSLRGQPLMDQYLRERGVDVEPPSLERLQVANLPNRFTAVLPWDRAGDVAKRAEDAVKEGFERLADDVREVVELTFPLFAADLEWGYIWSRQVEHFPESLGVYWVVLRWDRDPRSHQTWQKVEASISEFERLYARPVQEEGPGALWREVIRNSPQEADLGLAYPFVSHIASRLLDARKGLRDFRGFSEGGERCSLCGAREALHDGGSTGIRNLREFWARIASFDRVVDGRRIKFVGRIRRGERLCAVCLTRRLAWEHSILPKIRTKIRTDGPPTGEEHHVFPSTSTVATAAFKARVLQHLKGSEELRRAVREYTQRMRDFLAPSREEYDILLYQARLPRLERLLEEVPDKDDTLRLFLHIDGEWLYEESFDPEGIEREYGVGRSRLKFLEEARGALGGLLRAAEAAGCGRPARYFAIVSFDGDLVGEWLAGLKGPLMRELVYPGVAVDPSLSPAVQSLLNGRRPLGPAHHIALRDAMRTFALEVVPYAVEVLHCGKLVYAGGDDVLALVPLGDVATLLRHLRTLFSGVEDGLPGGLTVEVPGFVRWKQDGTSRLLRLFGDRFTASAGVVVVHHSHPLSHAVEEVSRAIKKHAKEKLGRDAFAIHVLRRSGEPLEVGFKWRERSTDVSWLLGRLTDWFRRGVVPSRLPFLLDEEGPAFDWVAGSAAGGGGLGPGEILTMREKELERVLGRHVDEGRVSEDEFREVQDALFNLLADVGERSGWRRVADLLRLARFLAAEE